MSVGGVSSGASAGAASYLSSPAVQFAQIQGSSLATLFGEQSGQPSDLSGFTATAVASSLFQRPGLLSGLTQWDGSLTPGSQRTPAASSGTTGGSAAPSPAPTPAPAPIFSFNPFDRASWWTDPKGSNIDTSV